MKSVDLTKAKKGFTFDRATLKKIFTKQTFMLITIVGALLLLVVYMYVYKDYEEKTAKVEKENRDLEALLDELEVYHNNMKKYEKEIEEIKTAVVEIMAEYPANAKEEDVIMLAVEMQEQNDIEFDTISMKESESVYTVPQNLVQMADIEGYDKDIVFTQKPATYSNKTDYSNLKGNIEQIFDSPNRIAIDKIVYVKNDSTGLLEGSMDMFFYSAFGTDREYVAPDIAEYIHGTSDLFKSDKVVNDYEPAVREESASASEATDTEEGTDTEEAEE